MCQQCHDLEDGESIHCKSELNSIYTKLMRKITMGRLNVSCLLAEEENPCYSSCNYCQSHSKIINMMFSCTDCHGEYILYADTTSRYIGFFSPNKV